MATPVGLRGHGAIHNRDINAGLLPDIAILHDAGDTTATICSCPCILTELGAINVLNGLAD